MAPQYLPHENTLANGVSVMLLAHRLRRHGRARVDRRANSRTTANAGRVDLSREPL
jgi:hypothetical protein